MNKKFKNITSILLFIMLILAASMNINVHIGYCEQIAFRYSQDFFVMKYNGVMNKMSSNVEIDGQVLHPNWYTIKNIQKENDSYINAIEDGPNGPSIYIVNDMKHMYDNSWKVYTTTVIVDIDNVRHPVVTALLETVAVIYTANSSPTDYIIDADMRRGIESVLDREQKSFEFDLGTWTYRIENATIDGDGKIRIKITTVHN